MKRRKIDIPSQDGGILAIPDHEDIPMSVEKNRKIFSEWEFSIGVVSAQSFRDMSREESLELAKRYTTNFTSNYTPIVRDDIIIETGHQPNFSHPGVIAKYFFINNLTEKNNYVGLNLIVNSDTVEEIGLNIPDREKTHLSLLTPDKPIPLETTGLIKKESFNQFLTAIDNALDKPYLSSVRNNFTEWESEVKNNPPISEEPTLLLTHLRRLFTREEKLLELPISVQSEGTAFLTFFLHIVQNAERFTNIYNNQLSLYRKVNKVRNETHPFPNLKIDDYIEIPFWHIAGEERKKISVKVNGDKVYLKSNGLELAIIPMDKIDRGIDIIRENGLKIRPNGLTTTMFNRMFISNLFIHGTGGAQYDIVTDAVIKEFFGAEPPLYATVTMTKHPDVTVEDRSERIKELEEKLRNIEYNPDRYVDSNNLLVTEKKKLLLDITKQVADKKQIGGRISAINLELLSTLKEEIKNDTMELDKLKGEMGINVHIRRRDYPYFFFKAAMLNSIVNIDSYKKL